ncbi:MAG: glycine cleavage system protein GcvH, partial [Chloroflexi bacterium]
MVPQELKYTDQHEWVRLEGSSVTVGITDHAQNALGEITFVELPAAGAELAQGDEACAIESCKAAAGVYAPADGKVTEANEALTDDPGLVNRDCYGEGWIYKMELSNPSQIEKLMTA